MMYKTLPHDAVFATARFVAYERERKQLNETETTAEKAGALHKAKTNGEDDHRTHELFTPPDSYFTPPRPPVRVE